MHYQVADRIVRSENAAKPGSQANRVVLDYISGIREGANVLDYGCGKLRYTIPAARRAGKVMAVDSHWQINRPQTVCGEKTTLLAYTERFLPNVQVCDVEADPWRQQRYDYILCTNVLSAIPAVAVRYQVLRHICAQVHDAGEALITTQYYNSYFSTYAAREDVIPHEDGWLIPNGGAYAFYGILRPDRLLAMCEEAGLQVKSALRRDGSIFVVAKRGQGT